MNHAFTSNKTLKEGDVREPCSWYFAQERGSFSSLQMASSSHIVSPPCGLFFSSPFNNLQKNLPTSPDYTLSGHTALWLMDLHARPLTALPPSLRRYRARW